MFRSSRKPSTFTTWGRAMGPWVQPALGLRRALTCPLAFWDKQHAAQLTVLIHATQRKHSYKTHWAHRLYQNSLCCYCCACRLLSFSINNNKTADMAFWNQWLMRQPLCPWGVVSRSIRTLGRALIGWPCPFSLFWTAYSKLKRGKMWISPVFSPKPCRSIAHIVSLKGRPVEAPPPVVCNLPCGKESITVDRCSVVSLQIKKRLCVRSGSVGQFCVVPVLDS